MKIVTKIYWIFSNISCFFFYVIWVVKNCWSTIFFMVDGFEWVSGKILFSLGQISNSNKSRSYWWPKAIYVIYLHRWQDNIDFIQLIESIFWFFDIRKRILFHCMVPWNLEWNVLWWIQALLLLRVNRTDGSYIWRAHRCPKNYSPSTSQ